MNTFLDQVFRQKVTWLLEERSWTPLDASTLSKRDEIIREHEIWGRDLMVAVKDYQRYTGTIDVGLQDDITQMSDHFLSEAARASGKVRRWLDWGWFLMPSLKREWLDSLEHHQVDAADHLSVAESELWETRRVVALEEIDITCRKYQYDIIDVEACKQALEPLFARLHQAVAAPELPWEDARGEVSEDPREIETMHRLVAEALDLAELLQLLPYRADEEDARDRVTRGAAA